MADRQWIRAHVRQAVVGIGGGGLTSPVGIADGGTGQTAKTAAFDALSPITTAGDLVVGVPAWAAAPVALGAMASQWIEHAFAVAGVAVSQTGTLT